MTTAGTGDGGGVRGLRALTAVVALYALVMQAVLGGIADRPVAAPLGVPCLGGSGKTGGSDPAPGVPSHHHACCTAACAAAGTPPPLPAAVSIARPRRHAVRVAWRMDGLSSPRASPGTLACARAPPAV